ncbi:hypothetical protein BH23ACT5_BH23ACT5_20880 [soil metagenome]
MSDRPVIAFADRAGPSIWDALAGDPTHLLSRDSLSLLERDSNRWSARYLRSPLRLISRCLVAIITLVKRLLPGDMSSHAALDRLGVWFMSRFVSQEGGELLLRHFILETNVLAFIARNAGLEEPTLRPTSLDQLGDNAVVIHDVNVYELLTALNNKPLPRPEERTTPLDFTMLDVDPVDTARKRRWMRLDLETGLACMNIAFALFTTAEEYRRAVHSLQLDESLLSCLAELTGDELFRVWRPSGYVAIVRTNRDVPRDLFAHAIVHEYAHARLEWLADRAG